MGLTKRIEFYKKRQFSDKLNATFHFIRENAVPYLKIQLMISGPILLIANILTNQISFNLLNFGDEITANFFINLLEIYGLVLIMTLVTTTILPLVTFGYMRSYDKNGPEDISVASVTQYFGSKFFQLLAFNLLMTIMVFFGMLFFIIPGIYLAVVFTLGSSIIMFEETNAVDALGRCFKLIKEKWWSTFGLLVVMGIIGYVISMFFGLPRIILFGVKAFTLDSPDNIESVFEMSMQDQVLNILFSVFETFGNILLYSLTYMAIAFQYFNLVERQESRGLMTRIEQMDDTSSEEADETF